VADAVRFIRESHATVVRPELLGLPPLSVLPSQRETDADVDRLYQALHDGDGAMARGIVMSMYLTGSSIAALFDGPIAKSLHRLGILYVTDQRGVLIEHRAVDLVVQVISGLRQMLPAMKEGARAAVGGAPPGDPYLVPGMMCATILAEAGYAVRHYGPETPLHLLSAAAKEARAQVVYVSVTSESAAGKLENRLNAMAEDVGSAVVVLGGQELRRTNVARHDHVRVMGSMGELAAFARQSNGNVR
jgi:methanogenic corrinoid protein MtbC1